MARRRKRGSRRGYKKHRRAGKKRLAILPLLPVYGPTLTAMSSFAAGRSIKDVGNTFMAELTGVNPINRSISYGVMGQQGMLMVIGILGHKLAGPVNRRLPKWLPIRL